MVGEAIAISYLDSHGGCYFPWPSVRDKRNPNASLPGADLLGLYSDQNEYCFLFGEVKTSMQNKSPPGVMRGDKGMTHQLTFLKNSKETKEQLITYLAHRAESSDWKNGFRTAFSRYQTNENDYKFTGVLIRDCNPNSNDLKSCLDILTSNNGSAKIEIKLLGLYIPETYISKLVTYFQ